jgi:multimeric flavodoxin WrbA
MKVIAIQSSPNKDGLTYQLAMAALTGAQEAGAETELVNLTDLNIGVCKPCGRGWGQCRENGRCGLDDDFNGLRDNINAADGVVFATPVYFGDLSEDAKTFLDRWRRCEIFNHEQSVLKGKRVIGIAAGGGSGAGTASALANLERYLLWLQLTAWDLAAVTDNNKARQLQALETAGKDMVRAKKPRRKRERL